MALIEVRMPQDDNEGTKASLSAWLKQPGDVIHEHEPLVEISTDKVTLELPAPATGVLGAHLRQSGETVVAGDLLTTIDSSAEAASSVPSSSLPRKQGEAEAANPTTPADPAGLSPATRRLLTDLNLDPTDVPKLARGGRLTPQDIAAHLKRGAASPIPAAPPTATTGRLIPHTPMRQRIASHMSRSMQTAPHVTSVFEADMSAVFADRTARKQAGSEPPTVTAYIIQAALQAIKVVPEVNAKWHEAHLELFDHVHFGVATALAGGGLVVPVIRNAHKMDILDLNSFLRAITAKARNGKLTPSDMEGGTFTLSNHGVSGSLIATPIVLPHGQAAIIGTGKVQKRVVVCDTGGRELFRIRPMMYVTLTIDHRVLDGQQANAFLSAFVEAIEKL